MLHYLSEKKKQSDDTSRTVYQPYKHMSNSVETNGSDGPASVEMSTMVDDRGLIAAIIHMLRSCFCLCLMLARDSALDLARWCSGSDIGLVTFGHGFNSHPLRCPVISEIGYHL